MLYRCSIRGKGNKAIIIFPHWYSSRLHYWIIGRALAKSYTVIEYHYTPDILTSDVKQTKENFREIIADATRRAKAFETVDILGFSIGSYLSFMLSKKIRFRKLLVVTTSSRFSDLVWHSKEQKLKRIRGLLENKGITEKDLIRYWRDLSPQSNIKSVKRSICLVLSKGDRTIPMQYAMPLIKLLKKDQLYLHKESHDALILYYLLRPKIIVKMLNRIR